MNKYPYLELRLSHIQMFDENAKLPETEEEILKWADMIACELSPENLYCDGEINSSQARKKYIHLMKEKEELESILGRKIDLDY